MRGIAELEPLPPDQVPHQQKDDSDKPTPDQVKQLEREHKLLFIYLAITNNMYCNLYDKQWKAWHAQKLPGTFLQTPQGQTIMKLGQTIRLKAKNWYDTQTILENEANIPKVEVGINDFLIYSKRGAIMIQAGKWIDKSTHKVSGIGIIPLIIWGVIAIISAISAAYIIKRLTTTTADREDLLKASEQTCKDLNLTPAECADVVTTTQKEESKNAQGVTDSVKAVTSGVSDILLYGLLAIGAFMFLKSSK